MRPLLVLAALLAAFAACSPSPTEPDYEFGRIDVYVRDTAEQPVNGVGVRLERMDGQIEDPGGATGTAGLPGYYFFLRTDGQFRVVLTLPAGYQLAEGQSGVVTVTFKRNELQTLNFVLRRP